MTGKWKTSADNKVHLLNCDDSQHRKTSVVHYEFSMYCSYGFVVEELAVYPKTVEFKSDSDDVVYKLRE